MPRLNIQHGTTFIIQHTATSRYTNQTTNTIHVCGPLCNFKNMPISLSVYCAFRALALKSVIILTCYITRSSATAEKQRVSCPHRVSRGPKPSSPLPFRPLWLHLCVWSYGRIRKPQWRDNVHTSSVLSVKCTLRWIGHSRSFKVILIGAGWNPGWSVVLMCN